MLAPSFEKIEFVPASLSLSADSLIAAAGLACTALLIAIGQYVYCFILAAKRGRVRWTRNLSLPPFCGFLAKTVVTSDEAELFIHAQGPFYVLVQHATREDEPKWRSPDFQARVQTRRYEFWTGLPWADPIKIPIAGLSDGAHIVDIVPLDQKKKSFRLPMLIRRSWKPVVVVSCTNTWHAYNNFGGLSNYDYTAVPLPLRPLYFIFQSSAYCFRLSDKFVVPTVPLSVRRPLQNIHQDLSALQTGGEVGASHLYRGELCLLRALDKLGIPYAVAGDEDLENFSIVHPSVRLVVFNTHSEYWSNLGICALKNLIMRDTSVAFLSGNNIYRRVERAEFGLQVVSQMIDGDATARIIGASYDALGYQTFAGFRVVDSEHWVFSGCHELRAAGFFGRGDGSTSQPGRSGHETDKVRPASEGFQLLALGENAEGGACMVCRDLPNGGFIFNAASISFTAMIENDPSMLRILQNLVSRSSTIIRTQKPDHRQIHSVS